MFLLSPRRFHSLLLAPALLPLLFLFGSTKPNDVTINATDATYTAHGNFYGSFPFSDPIRIVSWGQVAHGELRVFGPYNGYSQDSFIYLPNYGYVGGDSFTYHACDSNNNCVDGTINLNVVNGAPHAVSDSYPVHRRLDLGGDRALLENDTDPDGDSFRVISVGQASHGTFTYNFQYGTATYIPDIGFTGTDSATYHICDYLGQCDDSTVTFNVADQPPHAVDDSYTVHRRLDIGGDRALLENDSDPEGDYFHVVSVTPASHGTFNYIYQYGAVTYIPDSGFVGTDTVSYQACDDLGQCANATVSLNVVNRSPEPPSSEFKTRINQNLFVGGPDALQVNNCDPDHDFVNVTNYTQTDHGTVFYANGYGYLSYAPEQDFVGQDSFDYTVCDDLGACTTATAVIDVKGNDTDDGETSCEKKAGEPINVTTGNMYLQQNDYQLPSVGYGIDLARTYNSKSQKVGIFGRGWSSMYDESIHIYSSSFVRFGAADGKATYFSRSSTGAAFSPIEQDLRGQIAQSVNGSFTLAMVDGSATQFNSGGKLLSLMDRNGNATSLTYDSNGFLSSVTDPFGRALTLTTNANGLVTSISDTMGTVATYTYGGNNELLSVIYADNSAFNFAYDGSLRLTTVTDALGHIVESHTYDNQGRALTSEKQGGVDHYSLNYISATETDVTDGLGRITKYTFDTSKGRNVMMQVEGLCSCGGGSGSQVQSWTYDNQLNVTSNTDALGHVTNYTYDATGNRLTETDPTGTVTFTYNQFSEELTRTDQLNFVTTNAFDVQGNLLSTTDARGKTTNFVNDSRGLLLSVSDARDKTTDFTYDLNGNLIKRTDALLHDTQFAYDARGRLTSTTNALGFTTSFAYDSVGRLTQITQADGSTIGCEYDLAGRRTAMTDAKGNRSTSAYDAANRLIMQTDALNQSTTYDYDAMSNLTSTTDALSRTTNYEYDDFNRLVKTTTPAATTGAPRLFETIEYDAGGNIINRIDTAGRTTQYQYDALNRLTGTIDAENKTTSFEYDALSRMTALVDAIGQRYRFNYNPLGAVTHLRRGTDVMSLTYDAVGNRKTRTDYNGAVTDYTYDAVNRLKTTTYPDTTAVNYTYDKLSRLQTATNENGTVNFDYNKMNRMVRATDVFGQIVEYNYDPNGNRTKLSLNSAVIQTYKYDAIDRVTKILDAASLATNYTYDATNKLASRRLPNGVLTTYQYDGLDRLTRLLDQKGVTTVADHQYQYSTASQITQIAEPTITKNYGYDAIDRLTSASYSNPLQQNENYSYDALGNRTASQLSASYSYQRFNRLASTAAASYYYDANGNVISKADSSGTTHYAWDCENRLKQVSLPNGTTVTYKYDALGRRIQRTPSPGVQTNFVYDNQDVVRDLNSDGSTVDYLNGPGIDNKLRLTDSRLSGLGPLYFIQDQVGSTSALTNFLGVVVNQFSYDSFGNSSGSTLTRYTYTGREFDSDTGLYYYRARWYNPEVGRFISEDPVRFLAGINWYDYVANGPVRWIDPFGWARFFYWPAHGASKFGHVSLRLDDGTYISYWPSCRLPKDPLPYIHNCPARKADYEKDLEGEDNLAPLEIQIDGLDEAAIKRWWNSGTGHGDFGDLNNCSDVVSEALRIGGLPVRKTKIYTTPEHVKDEIEKLLHDRKYPAPTPRPAPTPCPGKCR